MTPIEMLTILFIYLVIYAGMSVLIRFAIMQSIRAANVGSSMRSMYRSRTTS
jgi:hypothetical protein